MNLRKKILTHRHIGTSVLCALFVAPIANAGALKTASNSISFPVALSFPAQSTAIESAILRFGSSRFLEGFDVSQRLDDVTIHDPFLIQLKGVQLKSRVQGRLDRDSNGIIAEATLQNLEVGIDSISIHTVVSTRVAGVDANIRVDADCKSSVISWSGQTLALFARGKLQTQPALAVVVSGLALPTDLPKPNMTLSCTGPVGIEATIRDYAWAALKQRWTEDSFAKLLEVKIQNYFGEALKIGGDGLNLANQPNMQMILHPTSYEVTAGGSHLRATLDVKLDRPVSINVAEGDEPILPVGIIVAPTLTVPVTTAQTLVRSLFTVGVWSEWLDAQAIEGFRELMASRFKQFFAFPDLMNYAKEAPFWFVMGLTSNVTLKCNADGMDITAPLSARMLLQDSSLDIGYKALVLFQLPTHLSLAFPKVSTKTAMVGRVQSIDLSATFDARYVARENPDTSIATDSILPEVQTYAGSKLKDLTAFDGALGESVKLLNQTDVSCGAADQMLRLSF
ncbi:hypothetical protein BH10BDE1_BH10BDE1_15360 [soil metagenome]